MKTGSRTDAGVSAERHPVTIEAENLERVGINRLNFRKFLAVNNSRCT